MASVGVAFSGGGIRSASFSAGVLNTLLKQNVVSDAQTLLISCVSGGGYAGSSFIQHLMEKKGDDTNFTRQEAASALKARFENNIGYLCNWHGKSLLNPSCCARIIQWFVGLFRGIFDTIMMIFAILAAILFVLLSLGPLAIPTAAFVDATSGSILRSKTTLWFGILIAGLAMAAITCLVISLTWCCCNKEKQVTNVFRFLFFAIFSYLTLVLSAKMQQAFDTKLETDLDDSIITAIISGYGILQVLGLDPKGLMRSSLVGLFALLMTVGHVTEWKIRGVQKGNYLFFGWLEYDQELWKWMMICSVGLMMLHPIFSFCRQNCGFYYYRWRLQKAFYPTKYYGFDGLFCCPGGRTMDEQSDSTTYISNTTVSNWNLTDRDPKDHALFAVEPTRGWRIDEVIIDVNNPPVTRNIPFGNMKISKAMAISAAAVSSRMGNWNTNLSKFLSVFSLFGMNLGVWVSPNGTPTWKYSIIMFGLNILLWIFPIISVLYKDLERMIAITFGLWVALIALYCSGTKHWGEMLASPLMRSIVQILHIKIINNEQSPYVFMSDGGHAENLALLPLLSKCPDTIIIADGGEDSEKSCKDLIDALALARKHLKTQFFQTQEGGEVVDVLYALNEFVESDKASFRFNVTYHSGNVGTIHYLKPVKQNSSESKLGGCCCECCSCCCSIGKFPNHSTANQFFYPSLFNAYYEAGVASTKQAFPLEEEPVAPHGLQMNN